MELQQKEKAPQVEIRNEEHVAGIIDTLGNETHTLTIKLEHLATDFPATLLHVDPECRRMRFSLLDAQSLSEPEIAESQMTLRAENLSDTLYFDSLPALEVTRKGDCLEILCPLPRALYTTSKRRSTRIPFVHGMYAKALVSVFSDHPPITAKVCNLSSGGCLLEVPLSASAFCRVDEQLPSVGLEFPNGETFTATGSIRHVKPAGRSHSAAVGIAFTNLTLHQENRLIHLVNEAEHEAAYRSGSNIAINTVLTRIDFGQLGQLDCLVRPEYYQLAPF